MSSSSMIPCPVCDTRYKSTMFDTCPNCKHGKPDDEPREPLSFRENKKDKKELEAADSKNVIEKVDKSLGVPSQVESLLAQSIEASNRTTRAIRALGIFLFSFLTYIIIGTLALYQNLSTTDISACIQYGEGCGGNWFLRSVTITCFVGGPILSLMHAWREFVKSEF